MATAGGDRMTPLLSYLDRNETEAVRSLLKHLDQELGSQIKMVALFGSKARRDATKDSDIDLLIILEQESWLIRREISGWAADISLKYDVLIEPRVIGSRRWNRMSRQKFTLYQNIMHDTVVLHP
jgi:predicted nucleotidyltransferase